ncbi:hypothetical protein [Breznakia pachnodae]|uniref:Uncharacterized protein n=1 Tax=Breznakia pachnodae TaxID=265178 RepID=A0ABU0E6G8_9FIRM|nr:hypothetical protein [Breznakia pachnodae]MDQ0362506.1 hypothetical protein [Breznakia pachnodae]
MNEYYKQDEFLQLKIDVELALLDYLIEVDITHEELIELKTWISEGNDYNDNGNYVSNENGQSMDFINAERFYSELCEKKSEEDILCITEEIINMISKMDINDEAKHLHMTAIRIIANAAAPYSETYRILQLSKQQHAELLQGDDS